MRFDTRTAAEYEIRDAVCYSHAHLVIQSFANSCLNSCLRLQLSIGGLSRRKASCVGKHDSQLSVRCMNVSQVLRRKGSRSQSFAHVQNGGGASGERSESGC